jgi:hypothetical protein
MSDEDESGVPAWVFWSVGGLVIFGVGLGSVAELWSLGWALLLCISSVVLGVIGWFGGSEEGEARQWFLTAGMFAVAFAGIVGGIRFSSEVACYRAKQVADAVVEYRADHGEYPDNLGELSPEYVRWPYLGGLSTTHSLRLEDERIQWGMSAVEVGTDECGPIPGSPLPADVRRGQDEEDVERIDY